LAGLDYTQKAINKTPLLTPREVSSAVNSVRNNGPELIEPTAS
jgi:putative SOS response-associated peptidase YedK